MAKRLGRSRKTVKQDLDMADHSARLRAIPGNPWEIIRGLVIWLAAGVLLFALVWLALGR